ncbi:MAG: dTDP-4-dehydrorhamnose 3,5-epimerase family protein, partial [Gemmatimonadaceae bacterium]|nr:dTDP-4-dehydrorhamnose 3,5-epimerase family protein [Gemmatimonadaceae bacterium]
MKLSPTDLPDVMLVDIDPRADDRGFFARTFSADAFEEAGLNPVVAQANIARTHHAGTLRGLHFQ